MCDRSPVRVAEKQESKYFVDNPNLYGKEFEYCLGYFWYLTIPSTRTVCENLDLIRHYRPDDVSFSLFYDMIGLDFFTMNPERQPVYYNRCSTFKNNPIVSCVQCSPSHPCLKNRIL